MTGMKAGIRIAALLCGVGAGLAGCVPPSENNANTTPAQQGATEGQVCHEERPLGSNISRTVCRPQDDAERDRRDAQKFMATPRPVPSTGD